MIALKGLSQLGFGSPTNKDIKGKKITPSGGIRVTGPSESGNGGKPGSPEKFPQEVERCLRACRSFEKLKLQTEESRIGNRSSSWARLGSPIPRDRLRNTNDKSNEKRMSINKLRGQRGGRKVGLGESGQVLSPKLTTKIQFKTSIVKPQNPLIHETSFLRSPKKSVLVHQELNVCKAAKGSELKKPKVGADMGEKKKKKPATQKLDDQLFRMNSESTFLKPQPKQKKNLREYILNVSPPADESQLKRNKSLKKTFEPEHKKAKVSDLDLLSVDDEFSNFLPKKTPSKIKMPKVAFKPLLMPAKDINQGGALQRAKSPGAKSKKTLSLQIQEIPDTLKQKIGELMSKKKSIDSASKPLKKAKSKFTYKKVLKTPSNDLVGLVVDPGRAKSPKFLTKNHKKKKGQKKIIGSKPVEEIEFEGRIYTLKEQSRPYQKKPRESSTNQFIDIDLNNESARLKPRDSVSSDEEGTPHSREVILRTPTIRSSLHKHSHSQSGLRTLVGVQCHVELEDVVGHHKPVGEPEQEQHTLVEQPVRIPAYDNQKHSLEELAKPIVAEPVSGSNSRKKSKASSSDKKNLIINTSLKLYDRPEVDSLVVIEQSEDGQVKKVDEAVQVSIDTFRKSDRGMAPIKSDISIIKKEDILQKDLKLEELAKEEYKKWNQVNSMLKDIEEKIGSKAATEIKELFSRLDTFANQSKKNLKEAFLASDICFSNQQSDRRSKINDDFNTCLIREQRFAAVFHPNETNDDSSRNNSFQPSVNYDY